MPKRKSSIVHVLNDDELRNLVVKFDSVSQILTHLDVHSGSMFRVLKQRIIALGIDEKFRNSQFWNRNKTVISDSRLGNSNRLLTSDSTASTSYVRKLLIKEFSYKEICSRCKIEMWEGEKLPVELDHINGDNRDNRLKNLRFLCPNCHSLTKTWRGRNKNTGTKVVSDDALRDALVQTKNIRQALLSVGLTPKGGNYSRCYNLISPA